MEAIERQLDRARQGDSKALSMLYKRFLPGVFSSIATRVPDRAITEDLTSEVFLQMIEGIHHLRAKDEAGFVAWLLRIARVVVAGYSRKREKQAAQISLPLESWEEAQAESLIIQANSPDTDPAYWTEAREDWNAFVQAINMNIEQTASRFSLVPGSQPRQSNGMDRTTDQPAWNFG